MSRKLAGILQALDNVLMLPLSQKVKRKTRARLIDNLQKSLIKEVITPKAIIKFLANKGYYVSHAADNFFVDEPETLEWIDTYVGENEIMWDIGANIGTYAMYAATNSKANVYAFEPFALNYGILAEHIHINNLDKKIFPYAVALAEETKADALYLRRFEAAGALNSVGEARNQFGEYTSVMSQATLLVKPDDMCRIFNVPKPDHVKLDVDSIEVQIVRGLKPLLNHIKTITIEIEGENEKNDEAEIFALLSEAGFEEIKENRQKGHGRNRLYIRK
jgi:FkbM family methyltransferase